MTDRPSIQCFVLSRDRSALLARMIASISQVPRTESFFVTISDTSTKPLDKQMAKRIAAENQIHFLDGPKGKDIWGHLQFLCDRSESSHIMFLHDDDEISNRIFKVYLEKLAGNPSIVALNGMVSTVHKNGQEVFNKPISGVVSTGSIVEAYTFNRMRGLPSFPFYVFQTSALKKALEKPLNLGIYSDFELLIRLRRIGQVEWVSDIVGRYYWHGQNMSSVSYIEDRRKMAALAKQVICDTRSKRKVDAWLQFQMIILAIKKRNFLSVLPLVFRLKTLGNVPTITRLFWKVLFK